MKPDEQAIEALRLASVALDDWVHSYAPELCDPVYVEATQKRISEYGTLAYIAHVQALVKAALERKKA